MFYKCSLLYFLSFLLTPLLPYSLTPFLAYLLLPLLTFLFTPLLSNPSTLHIDLSPYPLISYSLNLSITISVGMDFGKRPEREKEICHIVAKGSNSMGRLITIGLPMWDVIPFVKDVKTARNEVWKDLKPVLNDRRAAMERGEMADVDDCLTAMIRDDMEDKDVIDHVTTLICAGHDTTAFFTAYLFLCLAQNPDCQEQLRAEVLRVVGDKDVTAESVAEMKYLQKVTR